MHLKVHSLDLFLWPPIQCGIWTFLMLVTGVYVVQCSVGCQLVLIVAEQHIDCLEKEWKFNQITRVIYAGDLSWRWWRFAFYAGHFCNFLHGLSSTWTVCVVSVTLFNGQKDGDWGAFK